MHSLTSFFVQSESTEICISRILGLHTSTKTNKKTSKQETVFLRVFLTWIPKTDRITRVFSISRFVISFGEKNQQERSFHLCKNLPSGTLTVCHNPPLFLVNTTKMLDVPTSYASFLIPECITKQGKPTESPPSVLAHDHRKGDSSPADLKKSCHDNHASVENWGSLKPPNSSSKLPVKAFKKQINKPPNLLHSPKKNPSPLPLRSEKTTPVWSLASRFQSRAPSVSRAWQGESNPTKSEMN